MRKTVLMLINGFGIERSDSTEVFTSKLMPNLDNLTKTALFSSLETSAGDFSNGYRIFSIPGKNKNDEDEIDKLIFEKKLDDIPALKDMISRITSQNTVHIFYTTENGDEFNKVREFIKIINRNKTFKIFVHLILTGGSLISYNGILKAINKIAFETGEYCKIGLVVGSKKINDADVLRALYKEQGEHWNESHKKFELLEKNIINPEDVSCFIVNGGFAIKEGDTTLFMNFESVRMSNFLNEISKFSLNQYSLYDFKDSVIKFLEKPQDMGCSYVSILESFNMNSLILTNESRINDINYYLNGMERKKTQCIRYAKNNKDLFATEENTLEVLNSANSDAIIIDFDIGKFTKLQEIKGELSSIDSIIGRISSVSRSNNFTFIISSLYGMHASVMDGVIPKIINFEGKVPLIYQSNEFVKGSFSLNSGDTYKLMQTFLTNVNDEVKLNKLVHKMSSLEKMLSKK